MPSTNDTDLPLSAKQILEKEREYIGYAENDPLASPCGLALSGGGIRSATFCLGVLQALARERKLSSFDYLSSVSGGGYLGAFLTAWVSHEKAGIEKVQESLRRSVPHDDNSKLVEPPEIEWLRRYSNYLAPRVGILSLDTLTLISAWLRNVVLNWIVLISGWWLLLLVPRWFVIWTQRLRPICADQHCIESLPFASWSSAVLFIWLLGAIAFNLDVQASQKFCNKPDAPVNSLAKQRFVTSMLRKGDIWANWTLVIPSALWSICMTQWLIRVPPLAEWDGSYAGWFSAFAVVGIAIVVSVNKFSDTFLPQSPTMKRRFGTLAMAATASILAVLAGAALIVVLKSQLPSSSNQQGWLSNPVIIWTFTPILLLMTLSFSGALFVGLAGTIYQDRIREWWSRLTARISVVILYWLILFLFSFYIPLILLWASSNARYLASLISVGWVATTVWGALRKAPEKSPAGTRQNYGALLNMAAAVAVLLILAFLAAVGTQLMLDWAGTGNTHSAPPPRTISEIKPLSLDGISRLASNQLTAENAPQQIPFNGTFSAIALATSSTLFVFLLFGWRLDINKFSLQSVYKNRLVRCYLGASNINRVPNPFTGFDLNDDRFIGELSNGGKRIRPYPIFNTAMNITQGRNLAWQERKAASFVFTLLHAGYELSNLEGDVTDRGAPPNPKVEPRCGYRPIRDYVSDDGETKGVSLGTAMATSGAAVSPNMGYHTRPTLSFLLTLANLRLGKWCPNPRKTSWKCTGSGFAPVRLLQELGGRVNEESRYVYLSDGGHFENIGLYELVRRKCGYILVIDAAADTQRSFEDLGAAIRKCRIDFGAEISIDINSLRGKPPLALPDTTYAAGWITYRNGKKGKIVVIKASMCHPPEEPVDVQSYASRFTAFPQQSTADQFFDESQFESYRRLGYFAGCAAKDDFPPNAGQSEETSMENSVEKGHGDIGNQAQSFTQLLPPGERFDIEKLAALAKLMALGSNDTVDDGPDAEENLFVPAGYTYFGQFIDHDLTLDVTSSLNPEDGSNGENREPTNLRTPRFDLDCVYGTGPLDQPFMYASDGATLLLNTRPVYPPSNLGPSYDLARSGDGRAIIGDKRNDENTIVSQIQHAFILFHNLVVSKLAGTAGRSDLFREAQREVRWTYQRLLLDDFLPRIINKTVLDKLRAEVGNNKAESDDGFRLYKVAKRGNLPREFVGAAYRYGHSAVRTGYRLNGSPGKNNGTALPIFVKDDADNPAASLVGFDPLPPSHVIDDWARFFPLNEPTPGSRRPRNDDMQNVAKANGGEGQVRLQYAYKIDTTLVDPLVQLPPKIATSDDVPESVRDGRPSLALLNLLRGNAYKLPSGQAVAKELNVPTLPPSQLAVRQSVGDEKFAFVLISTIDKSFEDATPLWFYILAEAQSPLVDFAEKKSPGDATKQTLTEDDLLGATSGDQPGPCAGTQLGPVGGRIVGEVFYGLLQSDTSSVWYAKDWKPMVGDGPVTMGKLLKFVGLPISNI